MKFDNRVTRLLGVEIPIVQAPMGWIARSQNVMPEFGQAKDLYFGGDMEAAIALTGEVCGRIDAVKSVANIISETSREFFATVKDLTDRYGR